jgi:type I restriction enzyme S subunit
MSDATKLGDICRPINVRLGTTDDEPEVFSVTKHEGIVLAKDYFGHRVASRDLTKYKVVEPGQFAYSTIHIDEGSVGRNRFTIAGVVSPMYTVFEVVDDRVVHPDFLESLLRMPQMIAIYKAKAGGSIHRRRSLTFAKFASIEVGLPPIEEQDALVRLLDSIDDVIALAAEPISLLRQLRSALLHEVSTGERSVDDAAALVAELSLAGS